MFEKDPFQDRATAKISISHDDAKKIIDTKLLWFWCVIDADDLLAAIDIDGYSHAVQYGGGNSTSRKIWIKSADEKSVKKLLKKSNIKPRYGEINHG